MPNVPRGTEVFDLLNQFNNDFPAKLSFVSMDKQEMELPYNPIQSNEISNTLPKEVMESAEIAVKYRGYIEREKRIADKILKLENITIPENFDFSKVTSLSIESRQKLIKHRPTTIAQASRIPGVSPADISVLLVFFGR